MEFRKMINDIEVSCKFERELLREIALAAVTNGFNVTLTKKGLVFSK
jgi:hypothetical protein